ncbi:MAG: hypothetical protein ACRC28_13910 [Clostridium sp.]|uniref:hypothetical protein n=1 Tax=Clostridium sp. TaxID=1506 RepID=UPI003F4122EE
MDFDKEQFKIDIQNIDKDVLDVIVENGIKKEKSFMGYVIEAFKELGFKNIFHDKNELIMLMFSAIIILIFSVDTISIANEMEMYKFTFIISPLFFLVMGVFSIYNAKEKNAFHIEMACKYNIYALIAIRMFFFSIMCSLINTLGILIAGMYGEINVFRGILLSITSLFIFSTICIYGLIHFKVKILKYLFIGTWIGINMIFNNVNNGVYEEFMIKGPIYIHIIISIVCVGLYIKSLSKLINGRKRGERDASSK